MSKLYKVIGLCLLMPVIAFAEGDERNWDNLLKNQYFAGKAIEESNPIIELEAPYRAEDPAIVPVKIVSKIAQTPARYIKKVWVLVDNNPFPFVGEFDFFPESGKADLAMRVRVNTYSNIRAIAETNDGKLSMAKKYVKASGGCSAPIGADLDEAMKRLGKMKFRLDEGVPSGQAALAQLMISHPNITGMQMDQMTRFVRKSHFVDRLKVTFNDKPVLQAKIDIAISADPNFRFYFVPDKPGELKAEFTDISCESPIDRAVCAKGQSYSQTFPVQP
ncbi:MULTISPECIES: quinoprotein dehydrogenase-associated SoxYZ-like carrier [Methylomonas]|uniref:quinoprotein dehydrogenase-associated SoxYZ-like carrier n=1 Tax=Methylomonas TaxID=416 RepID=UPI001231B3A9|nr:quinoprotein dehydrogenase-associated SoxYZ-like carrier [Methylomonas rhizoryzae]